VAVAILVGFFLEDIIRHFEPSPSNNAPFRGGPLGGKGEVSGGVHGARVSAVNALSDWFELELRPGGTVYRSWKRSNLRIQGHGHPGRDERAG
jgi:hypothetical protein